MIRCINCGRADLQSRVIELEGVVRGQNYVVQMRGLECPKCGYKTVEGPDTPEFARLLADKYRADHDLLTSEQIAGCARLLERLRNNLQNALGLALRVLNGGRWVRFRTNTATS